MNDKSIRLKAEVLTFFETNKPPKDLLLALTIVPLKELVKLQVNGRLEKLLANQFHPSILGSAKFIVIFAYRFSGTKACGCQAAGVDALFNEIGLD